MQTDQVAAMITQAVRSHSMNSARTAQSNDNRLGASEIGMCRSYLWRVLRQEERREEGDTWKAFIGTALGDALERAVAAEFGIVHTQESIVCTLPSGRTVPGHVDVWTEPHAIPVPPGFVGATDPIADPGSVWDFKAKDGVLLAERSDEPDRAHKYQIALYHRGLVQAGKIEPDAPAYIVYVDRSGRQSDPVVKQVEVTEELFEEIDDWIGDAIRGVIDEANGIVKDPEPPRDRPDEWCKVACPFYDNCRGADQYADGLISDPELLGAVDMYREGMALEKQGAARKEEAKGALLGVAGSTGDFVVSWTHINATSINYERAGYDRLNLKAVKKPTVK